MPLRLCTWSKSWSAATGSSLPCEGWRAPKHLLCWKWTRDVWHVLPLPPLPGGRLSCASDPGSSWLSPEAWSPLSSCFSSCTWFTLCEALTLGPQGSIFILQPFVVASFSTYLSSACYVPGGVLNAGDLRMNEAQILPLGYQVALSRYGNPSLTCVGRLDGCHPAGWRVAGSIPSQGTMPGLWVHSLVEWQPINVSLPHTFISLSFSLPSLLSNNKINLFLKRMW